MIDLTIIVLLGLHQDLPGGRPAAAKDHAHGMYIISTSFEKVLFVFFQATIKKHPHFISPGNSRGQ